MLKLKLQYFGSLMQGANSLEKTLMLGKIEGRRKNGQQRMKWFDGITDSMDLSVSKLQEMVKDREAWHAAIHGVTKSWTWLSNNNNNGLNNWINQLLFISSVSQKRNVTGPTGIWPHGWAALIDCPCSGALFLLIHAPNLVYTRCTCYFNCVI